jgi:hypothetical protein
MGVYYWKGGFQVLQPDLGDPVEAVLMVREKSVCFDEYKFSTRSRRH